MKTYSKASNTDIEPLTDNNQNTLTTVIEIQNDNPICIEDNKSTSNENNNDNKTDNNNDNIAIDNNTDVNNDNDNSGINHLSNVSPATTIMAIPAESLDQSFSSIEREFDEESTTVDQPINFSYLSDNSNGLSFLFNK